MLNVMKAVTTAKTLFVNAKVRVQILEKQSRKKPNWTLDKDIENNLDYKICTTEESVKLGNCHLGCDYELDCVRNCTLAFYENVENCPCKVSFNIFRIILPTIFSQNVLVAVPVITTPVMTTPHRLWFQRHLLQWFISGIKCDQAIRQLSTVLLLASLVVLPRPTWKNLWIMRMQFILGQSKFFIWLYQIHKRLHLEWVPIHLLTV